MRTGGATIQSACGFSVTLLTLSMGALPSDRAQIETNETLAPCRTTEEPRIDRLERWQPKRYPSLHVH